MEADDRMVIIGQGLYSPWYVGSSMVALEKRFGTHRVIDCPVSENGTTGIAIGTALSGAPTVMVHPRMDFMTLATDQIFNQAAKWHYMFGGAKNVPLVIRGIINRGGEQAAQHSQALQAMYMNIPGLKVVMPSSAYDAKGLMVASVRDGNPVVFIDDRWLYADEEDVPEDLYAIPIGVARTRRSGTDVTVVAISYMVKVALQAADEAAKSGVDVDVIDLRSLKPLDSSAVLESVRRTGRLVVADAAWRMCGAASEVVAMVAEAALGDLRAPPRRGTLPEAPAP